MKSLPRFKFSIRTLLAVTFVVAVDLFLWRRSTGLFLQAVSHSQEAKKNGQIVHRIIQDGMRDEGATPFESNNATRPFLLLEDYHSEMARKYSRASGFPWLPVDRDPMPPSDPRSVDR